MIEDLLAKRNMTKYRLAVVSGVPHATLNDICSGKTRLEKCSESVSVSDFCRKTERQENKLL